MLLNINYISNGLNEPQKRGYMNTVHKSENDIIYCIICTEIINDDTEYSLQCVH